MSSQPSVKDIKNIVDRFNERIDDLRKRRRTLLKKMRDKVDNARTREIKSSLHDMDNEEAT